MNTNLQDIINSVSRKYGTIPPSLKKIYNMSEKELKTNRILQKLENHLKINVKKSQEKGGKVMPDKENKEVVQEFDLQLFCPSESFKRRLDELYQGNVVAVEFCCGDFLKKAIGCLNLIGNDFVELVGANQNPVEVNIYGPDGVIDTERAFRIIIPLEDVAGVELLTTPTPPPCPPPGPCPGRPDRPRNASEKE